MKKLEKKSIVMVVVCLMAGMASAGTIFTDGFNLEDGYSNDSPLANGWVAMTGELIPLIDGTPGRAPEGSACASVSYNAGGRGGYIDMATVGTQKVTLDFITYPGQFGDHSWGGFSMGFLEEGTEDIQNAILFNSSDNSLYTITGSTVLDTGTDYFANTATWYHVAIEVDYSALTAKYYIKGFTDISAYTLSEADVISTVSFTSGSNASRLFMNGANVFQLIDAVIVTEVPEPTTMTLLTSGLIGMLIKRRK